MPIAISKANHKQEVLEAKKPVLLDVFASWCGPCQQMAPIIEELDREYSDKYVFATLNVDESRELAIQYGVTSIPTFIFLKSGQVMGKATGYMSKKELLAKIHEFLD
jgi:thioredoxin 1